MSGFGLVLPEVAGANAGSSRVLITVEQSFATAMLLMRPAAREAPV